MKQIQYIDVNKIFPHKDNPRRDLGDLTELSESIKTAGIFQNLTVVPKADDTYTVIIGHRRHAASKLAGLKEVPCVVTEMSEKEQVATMLLENMQRSDLTIYEQAEGFQLMLDFGENIGSISEKTGFSESTVRRRVKLLELDKDKFKASVSRGGSLEDYAKLDKIKDPELKNKVLEKIGTNSFDWELRNAIDSERKKENMAAVKEKLATFAEYTESSTDKKFVSYIFSADFEIPEDIDTKKYYYMPTGGGYYLYAERGTEEITDEKALKQQEKARKFSDTRAKLNEIAKRSFELRANFIKNLTAKKNPDAVMRFAVNALIENTRQYRCMTNEEFCTVAGLNPETDGNVLEEVAKGEFMHPERALLLTAYCSFRDDEENNYHSYQNQHNENYQLDIIYNFLCEMGYELADEECAYKEGTHELFTKATSED